MILYLSYDRCVVIKRHKITPVLFLSRPPDLAEYSPQWKSGQPSSHRSNQAKKNAAVNYKICSNKINITCHKKSFLQDRVIPYTFASNMRELTSFCILHTGMSNKIHKIKTRYREKIRLKVFGLHADFTALILLGIKHLPIRGNTVKARPPHSPDFNQCCHCKGSVNVINPVRPVSYAQLHWT